LGVAGETASAAAAGDAALAGGTAGIGPVANAIEYGGLLKGWNPALAKAAGVGDTVLRGIGTAGQSLGKVNAAIQLGSGLMGGGQGSQMPMASQARPQAGPVVPTGSLYAPPANMVPPGVDPAMWAMMSPEEKRRMMMSGGFHG
jgi:hypothetical protein